MGGAEGTRQRGSEGVGLSEGPGIWLVNASQAKGRGGA